MSIRFEDIENVNYDFDIGIDKLIQERTKDSYRVGYIHGYNVGYSDAVDNEFDFYCRADDSTEYEQDSDSISQDMKKVLTRYGFPDTKTLVTVLDNYQKLICEMSHGNLSKMTYTPDVLLKYFMGAEY